MVQVEAVRERVRGRVQVGFGSFSVAGAGERGLAKGGGAEVPRRPRAAQSRDEASNGVYRRASSSCRFTNRFPGRFLLHDSQMALRRSVIACARSICPVRR